jgi:hypothetical protein
MGSVVVLLERSDILWRAIFEYRELVLLEAADGLALFVGYHDVHLDDTDFDLEDRCIL